MKKILFFLCVLIAHKSWSQNTNQQEFAKSNKPVPKAAVRNQKIEKKYNIPASKIHNPNANERIANGNSFLDKFSKLNDERISIEKDNSLSQNDRKQKIENINKAYKQHKESFYEHIKSVGFSNVSRNEQKQYVALLKEDNNMSDYKKYVELIKDKP